MKLSVLLFLLWFFPLTGVPDDFEPKDLTSPIVQCMTAWDNALAWPYSCPQLSRLAI